MTKLKLYLLGLGTLLMAPAGWLLSGMPDLNTFLQTGQLSVTWVLIGCEYGLLFGSLMLLLTSTEDAKRAFSSQLQLIRSMKLNLWDILFLSLCAGIGEELLFRVGLQHWIHPVLASLVFVAIHGYLIPNDWSVTRYGLLIFGFITTLSYAVSGPQGLWFCIAAHASYDFILFQYWSRR